MIISNNASTTSTSSASGTATGKQAQMGKDDFLKLLTVQLQYQDPLNPMDNTQFIAQMAQFSSLEQLQNMNDSLESNLTGQTELQGAFRNNLATSLVGRDVDVATEQVEYAGDDVELGYQLDADAASAHLTITDALGRVVRDFGLGVDQGYGTVTWDGTSDSGADVPQGTYLVAVQANDAAGGKVTGQALRTVRVEGVRYDAQEARIRADGEEYTMDQVGGVRE
jgi:flagellar basal-body rod modification protein FlgD